MRPQQTNTMLPKVLLALFATVSLAAPAAPIEEVRSLDERDPEVEQRETANRIRAPDANAGPDTHDFQMRQIINGNDHNQNGLALGGHSCPGNRVDTVKLFGGKATLYLYYAQTNGGTNCAYVNNNTGKGKNMFIEIWNAEARSSFSWDWGSNYKEYAGSVGVKKMAGKCVGLHVNFGDQSWSAPKKWHCR